MRSLLACLTASILAAATPAVPPGDSLTQTTEGSWEAAARPCGAPALAPRAEQPVTAGPVRAETPGPSRWAAEALSLDRRIVRARVRTPLRSPLPSPQRRRAPPRLEEGEPPGAGLVRT